MTKLSELTDYIREGDHKWKDVIELCDECDYLDKENAALKDKLKRLDSLFKESMEIVSDVWYWKVCPKDYKERIQALQVTDEAKLNKFKGI